MAIPVSDRLFRYSFSSPENAYDLARNLPPARQIGHAEGGGSLYLYVLAEHKSQPERWTPFQLPRYMLAVWSDVLRRARPEPEQLPAIIPVVLYQRARQWNSPLAFEALVDPVPAGGDDAGRGHEHHGRVPETHTAHSAV